MDTVQYIVTCGLLALYFSLRSAPSNKWLILALSLYSSISLTMFVLGFCFRPVQDIVLFWLAIPLLKDIISVYVKAAEIDIGKFRKNGDV